jgi:hypothetical protein
MAEMLTQSPRICLHADITTRDRPVTAAKMTCTSAHHATTAFSITDPDPCRQWLRVCCQARESDDRQTHEADNVGSHRSNLLVVEVPGRGMNAQPVPLFLSRVTAEGCLSQARRPPGTDVKELTNRSGRCER